MKSIQRHRSQVNTLGSKGFSLIELMVVVTILGITASIAVGAIRQDEVAGSYKRFVDDLQGKFIDARDYSVDEQTLVRLRFFGDRVEMRTWNQISDVWEDFGAKRRDEVDGAILVNTCVLGLVPGAVAPSAAVNLPDIAPPAACPAPGAVLGEIEFSPGGAFELVNGSFIENAGATVWVADTTVPGSPRLSMIQLFPGGLMRTFTDVS